MINKVILVGRLTADPEVKTSGKGVQVAKVRVATNSYTGKDEEGNRREHTEFHSLVLFGRQAEVAGGYLRKGNLLANAEEIEVAPESPLTPWQIVSQPCRVRMGGVPPPILSWSQAATGAAKR